MSNAKNANFYTNLCIKITRSNTRDKSCQLKLNYMVYYINYHIEFDA